MAQVFQDAQMKQYLSLGWIKSLACIVKELKKQLNPFDSPDN
jgi:hypothetical protein